jgi:tetraacyldisaccharide 4'-kinase
VPVVCVGNFVAGGAGKTPTAITLARMLLDRGEHPFFLSRGYGGSRPAIPMLVDASQHAADEVGDEPLLLARVAPTVVTEDRAAGAHFAIRRGASVIVMDDGLQSRKLEPDLALAVVDGETGIGNGLCIPAGPLRAPLAVQLPHVAAVVVVGKGRGGDDVAEQAAAASVPVLRASLVPDPTALVRLRGKKFLAFAGIGRPEKFFTTLVDAGLSVVATVSYPDHHRFRESDIMALQAKAAKERLTLVTTEKDATRLEAPIAETLPVTLVFADEAEPRRLLDGMLLRARSKSGP